MIDIKALEKKNHPSDGGFNLESYQQNLKNRGADLRTLDHLLELNQKRKEAIAKAEGAKAEQNKMSQSIPTLKKEGKDTTSLLESLGKMAAEVKKFEGEAAEIDQQVYQLALTLPNKLHETVPVGESSEGNQSVKVVGKPKTYGFKPKEHFELGEKLGIFDFDRAAKITGSRFSVLLDSGARLERALMQFFMDLHSREHGYMEMIPPYIVNSPSYIGTGQFPKFKDEVFHLSDSDYHLISTAEVPVTNFYREEVLAEADLPKKFCALSPCFRSEAGAAGKDTRGLIRQHQFHKVELMIFAHPARSYELHEQLTAHAERCLELLELPYKRMLLCSGDIGFGAAKCFDLEVWLPGANAYREISSCSNFEDFQARRANIRFKSKDTGKLQFVHTLNGSGLAVGRTLIAILENYQREDGSIEIPKVLRPYMGGDTSISAIKS
jgi:seryl-tRNA synthetase